MNGLRIILAGLLLALVTVPSAQADTLDNVLESRIVRCGATDGHKGFSEVSKALPAFIRAVFSSR